MYPETFKVHTIDRNTLENTYETHAFSKVIVKVVPQPSKEIVKKKIYIYIYLLTHLIDNKDYIKV